VLESEEKLAALVKRIQFGGDGESSSFLASFGWKEGKLILLLCALGYFSLQRSSRLREELDQLPCRWLTVRFHHHLPSISLLSLTISSQQAHSSFISSSSQPEPNSPPSSFELQRERKVSSPPPTSPSPPNPRVERPLSRSWEARSWSSSVLGLSLG